MLIHWHWPVRPAEQFCERLFSGTGVLLCSDILCALLLNKRQGGWHLRSHGAFTEHIRCTSCWPINCKIMVVHFFWKRRACRFFCWWLRHISISVVYPYTFIGFQPYLLSLSLSSCILSFIFLLSFECCNLNSYGIDWFIKLFSISLSFFFIMSLVFLFLHGLCICSGCKSFRYSFFACSLFAFLLSSTVYHTRRWVSWLLVFRCTTEIPRVLFETA